MEKTPLQKAVDLAGGQTALAKALSSRPGQVKQGHVWSWLHRDGRPPAEHCISIERATDGQVTRYDLRPDVFGPAPANDDSNGSEAA